MENSSPHDRLRRIASQTGTSIEKIRADMERDYWMSADEAIEYGIVSRIVEKHADQELTTSK